jgi:hypothetical protein
MTHLAVPSPTLRLVFVAASFTSRVASDQRWELRSIPGLRRPLALIEPWNQPPRAAAVRIVLTAELRAQQHLFRAYAREERWNNERREQQAGPRTKTQPHPSELMSNLR